MATTDIFTQNHARRSIAVAGSRLGSGLVAGWKAYKAFTALAALSDAELAAKGLARADLGRAAAKSAGLVRG